MELSKKKYFLVAILLLGLFINLHATTLVLSTKNDLVGEVQYASSEDYETIDELGKHFDVGYYELIRANPHLDPKRSLTGDFQLIIPSQHLLPDVPRKGIVINLAEYRLYYFPENENVVLTFPVGIGRKGWKTPLGATKIVAKNINPTWRPTKRLLAAAEKNGGVLPEEFPAGPYNPLGNYALRLGWPTFLIHGTNKHTGVGARVSAGCIRMYPEDIENLFRLVPTGTQVRVINEPIKIRVQNNSVVLQIYPVLDDQHTLPLQALLQKKLAALGVEKLQNNKVIQNELLSPSGLVQKIKA